MYLSYLLYVVSVAHLEVLQVFRTIFKAKSNLQHKCISHFRFCQAIQHSSTNPLSWQNDQWQAFFPSTTIEMCWRNCRLWSIYTSGNGLCCIIYLHRLFNVILFLYKVVQCYNRGSDGDDVQWECKTDIDNAYRFGKISVSCEGYSYPDDPYVLKGSCGVCYRLAP